MADNTPMAAAEMQYDDDGRPLWGAMWQTFCALAVDGGPPHRAAEDRLTGAYDWTEEGPDYRAACKEIIRGIQLTTGLQAARSPVYGWIDVYCDSKAMAEWMTQAIEAENVEARLCADMVRVPVSGTFREEIEIKSVITAVAKTYHYWVTHRAEEAADGPQVALSSDQQQTRLALRQALAAPAPPALAVGQRVYWETSSSSKRSLSIRRHDGEIIEINGDQAVVRDDNRKRKTVALAQLKTTNAQSLIGAFLRAAREQ